MKNIITLSAFVIGLALVLSHSYVYTNSAQAPAGFAGDPPANATCASVGCHTGSSVIVIGTFINMSTIGGNSLASGYQPGTEYNVSVNLVNMNKPKYGFSITALDASNNMAGTLQLGAGANANSQFLASLGGKQYLGHKDASSISTWTFKWTAPANNVGEVKFYIAANGADGTNTVANDQIYTTVFSVSTTQGLTREGGNTGIAPLSADDNNIKVFPNPAHENLFFEFALNESQNVSISLFNTNGQEVQPFFNDKLLKGVYKESFRLNTLAKGLYIARISLDEQVYFKKILVE